MLITLSRRATTTKICNGGGSMKARAQTLLCHLQKSDVRKTDALGRVYVVHTNNSEYFHLRILLHVIKGPTSFISLRNFQGITYEILQGFCKAMNLLQDDTH